MDNIYFTAGVISFIYLILKFIEMRFIDKESKPLKLLLRDTLLVFFSILGGHFILDQLNPVIDKVIQTESPIVFTDNPNF